MKPIETKRPPIVRLPPKSDFEIMLARTSQVSVIFLGLVALVFALDQGQIVFAPAALALIVGLMLGPLAVRLERRGLPSPLSAAIVVLVFILALCMIALALARPVSFWLGELPRIWQQLQVQLAELRAPVEAIQSLQEELRQVTGGESLTVNVEEGTAVQDMAVLAPTLLAQILFFMASLYFFVATRHQIRIAILRLCMTRRLRWRMAHVFHDVEAAVSRYLLSITVINSGLALAVTLGLWLAGVPSPALWGALAGMLNFIVYIGPAIMSAILLVVGLGTYDTLTASLMPPMIYLAINLVESQFVTPMVVGRTVMLNPFLVILALTFWIWLWGPIGGFIAIPAVLIVFAIARHIIPGVDLALRTERK